MLRLKVLRENSNLTQIAQNYAEYLLANDMFEHSGSKFNGDAMGENLHYNSSTGDVSYQPGIATDNWYNEIADYDFANGDSINGKAVGHFTQVVWKNTKEAGFGVAMNDHKCVVVGNYYPSGNFMGEETRNVLPK